MVITVDGLASSGKTTLSRLLAERLGFEHLNSGLLYRAVGWLSLRAGVKLSDPEAVTGALEGHTLALRRPGVVEIDGTERGIELQVPAVSEATSITAQYPAVRDRLFAGQREAFPGRNLVAEGRDMGTVVFPDAPLKFFVTAPSEVRARRRLEQLEAREGEVGPERRRALAESLQQEIVERDARDSQRLVAPTRPAAGAILIENGVRSAEAVVEEMVGIVRAHGLTP